MRLKNLHFHSLSKLHSGKNISNISNPELTSHINLIGLSNEYDDSNQIPKEYTSQYFSNQNSVNHRSEFDA